jgi:hypothetical protein
MFARGRLLILFLAFAAGAFVVTAAFGAVHLGRALGAAFAGWVL